MIKMKIKRVSILSITLLAGVWFCCMALAMPTELVPVGQTVGIDLKCDGVMVVGIGEVLTENGSVAPGAKAGLMPGDVIMQLGKNRVQNMDDFWQALEGQTAGQLPLFVNRQGQNIELAVEPAKDKEGKMELGLWLRDGMAGIGTLTFYDPESGIFGALGHSVSDVETATLMPLGSGYIMPSSVKSVRVGKAGEPGELQGEFDHNRRIGEIQTNSVAGIFGQLEDETALSKHAKIPVGNPEEIKVGAATILANVRGEEIETFDIEITRVFSGGVERNMMITITDPKLIAQTGGIVQGMSGSPILQDGKLIGAVTHVLINNPEKGYAISARSMLEHAFGERRQAA